MKPPWATTEEFIRIWQSCDTTAEVAARLGITSRAATVRANRIRTRGIPLKNNRIGGMARLDITAMKDLAISLEANKQSF